MNSVELNRIYRTSNGKFPVKIEDDFDKNLKVIEDNNKYYYGRMISDIFSEIKDYYYVMYTGEIWSKIKNGFLKFSDRGGYDRVNLQLVNGEGKHYSVHRLVLSCFDYNEHFSELEVNHLDGDKHNNHIDNLKWCTRQENVTHAVENGLSPRESERKMSENMVLFVCKLLEKGENMGRMSSMLNIPQTRVDDIYNGEYYRYISKSFNFKENINKYWSLSVKEVKIIKELVYMKKHKDNFDISYSDIADLFNVSEDTIYRVRKDI